MGNHSPFKAILAIVTPNTPKQILGKTVLKNHPSSPIPSGYVKIAIENGPVEIVVLPIEHGNFPSLCKRLPEGMMFHYNIVIITSI